MQIAMRISVNVISFSIYKNISTFEENRGKHKKLKIIDKIICRMPRSQCQNIT